MDSAGEALDKLTFFTEELIRKGVAYAPKLLLALVVLCFGLYVVRSFNFFLKANFQKRNIDQTLAPFLINLLCWGLRILLLISVASMVGIETTSFVAALGAASLAVGLALQGSLSNFSGGVLILLFRPFKQGDLIEAQGFKGVVQAIDIFATIINTADNKKVIIPNGPLAGGCIMNYTASPTRRVDFKIGVGYNDDLKKAQQLMLEMCRNHPLVLETPETFVGIENYADSSVILVMQVWTKTSNYWEVYYDLIEQVKIVFDANNISMPYPQREVHMITKN